MNTSIPCIESGFPWARLARALAVCALCAVLPGMPMTSALGQDEGGAEVEPANGGEAGLPTPKELEETVARLEAEEPPDDSDEARVLQAYRQARDQLAAAARWREKAQAFAAARDGVPTALTQARAQLAHQDPSGADLPETADLEQLSQSLTRAEAEVTQARQALDAMEAEQRTRGTRRIELPKLVAAARKRAQDAEAQLKLTAPPEEPPDLRRARLLALRASRHAAELEAQALEAEAALYDAQAELPAVRKDVAVRRVRQAEARLAAWQKAVDQRRRSDAERQASEARRAQAEAHPLVRELAARNSQLAERRTGSEGTVTRLRQATEKLETERKELARIREGLSDARRRRETVGLTHAVGYFLRRLRSTLPPLDRYRRVLRARREEIADAQVALIELEEERSGLVDIEAAVRRALSQLDATLGRDEKALVERRVRDIFLARREYLDSVIGDYTRYFPKLVDLDAVELETIEAIHEATTYIDRHVLWIRSTEPLHRLRLAELGRPLHWLCRWDLWNAILAALWRDFLLQPPAVLAGILAAAATVAVQPRARRALQSAREQWLNRGTARHAPRWAFLTAVVSAPAPMLVWIPAWRLHRAYPAPEHSGALASGFAAAGLVLWIAEFLRQSTRQTSGLNRLLGVDAAVCAEAGRRLWAGMLVLLPAVWLAVVVQAHPEEAWHGSLGRLAFVAANAVVWVTLAVCLRLLRAHAQTQRERDRLLWSGLALLALPLGLIVLSAMGYHFTTLRLAVRLVLTGLVAGIAGLAYHAACRWIQAAHGTFVAQAEGAPPAGAGPAADPGLAATTQELSDDLRDADMQSRRLLRMGVVVSALVVLGAVWLDVFPALGILERFTLWTHTRDIQQVTTTPDGMQTAVAVQEVVAVTVADLGIALLILAVAIVATRNIRGVLEMTILGRLGLDAGSRYAVCTVSQYAIVTVGILASFWALGVTWAKIQWLAAAATVGLGFGLQEIFANFVSGLIILFEQPIRVGDFVTIGDVEGTVTRIRIRATTVLDLDRRELVVPNREFVTGRLINWSLSDPITRLVLPVGIAYGSDTELARDVLRRVADEEPMALRWPRPTVGFAEFGDSSLVFKLRVYIARRDTWQQVSSNINFRIDRAFRKAGITIAFPQLDVHLDQPLSVKAALDGLDEPAA